MSEPRRVRTEMRNVAFPVSVRGYDRRAVDAYVTRVNRLIAELEATRSPQSAVKRALERTEEERDIVVNASAEAERTRAEADEHVAEARAEAKKILADSRTEAADRLRRAQEEIAALHDAAEAAARELRIDTEAIWGTRRALLDDLRNIATRLHTAASNRAAPTSSRDGFSV